MRPCVSLDVFGESIYCLQKGNPPNVSVVKKARAPHALFNSHLEPLRSMARGHGQSPEHSTPAVTACATTSSRPEIDEVPLQSCSQDAA
eukprot:6464972-Amphidinium_carterae.2